MIEILGIEPELFNATSKVHASNPENKTAITTAATTVELSERGQLMGADYEPLDRETILTHIEAIEMLKVQKMAGAVVAHKMGKIPDNKMGLVQEMTKMEAVDTYHGQSGIEENEIAIGVHTHELL